MSLGFSYMGFIYSVSGFALYDLELGSQSPKCTQKTIQCNKIDFLSHGQCLHTKYEDVGQK